MTEPTPRPRRPDLEREAFNVKRWAFRLCAPVNPLPEVTDALGFTSVWTYLALFLVASLVMIWRLEALLDHGLEGTALGTLVMPYCSGLGNLIFVALIATRAVQSGC